MTTKSCYKQGTVLLTQLAEQVGASLGPAQGDHALDISRPMPGLVLLRHPRPTRFEATIYEPVLCLILQGRKETAAGDCVVTLGPGESLLVSHDLPVISRIIEASPEVPYLAVIAALDLTLLRSLYEEVGPRGVDATDQSHALAPHATTPDIVDVFCRYLSLTADPVASRVLGPSILKELHYRLLTSEDGGMLRRLLRYDSHESLIANAISHLRREFNQTVSIPDLARRVGMSESSFYSHFKRITATTPLQYLKQLRLLEARRLITAGHHSIAEVAFEVGYESPSQFSREYSRHFGEPPSDGFEVRGSRSEVRNSPS